MSDNRITIAVQCHLYQQRLSWQLSSLVGQPVVVDVAHVPKNGIPTCEQLIRFFRRKKDLDVTGYWYRDETRLSIRGLVRNDQLARCKTPFLLFADADVVYSPDFFAKLLKELDPAYPGIWISGRMTMPVDTGEKLVASQVGLLVPDAYARTKGYATIKKRPSGAGFFQLIHMQSCKHGGVYVPPKRCRDWAWTNRGRPNTHSDKDFRQRIGLLRALPAWVMYEQVHLNHGSRRPDVQK